MISHLLPITLSLFSRLTAPQHMLNVTSSVQSINHFLMVLASILLNFGKDVVISDLLLLLSPSDLLISPSYGSALWRTLVAPPIVLYFL